MCERQRAGRRWGEPIHSWTLKKWSARLLSNHHSTSGQLGFGALCWRFGKQLILKLNPLCLPFPGRLLLWNMPVASLTSSDHTGTSTGAESLKSVVTLEAFPAGAPALDGGLFSREPSDSVRSQVCTGNHHAIQKEAGVRTNSVLSSCCFWSTRWPKNALWWLPAVCSGRHKSSGDRRWLWEREGALDRCKWFSLPTNVLWVFCLQTGGMWPGARIKAHYVVKSQLHLCFVV